MRWWAGVTLAVAVVAALALFAGDRRRDSQNGLVGVARRAAETVVSPVGRVLAVPSRWVTSGVDWAGDYMDAAAQNRGLKAQLTRAAAWRDLALSLRHENERLRAMLGVRTDPPIPMVSGRTILDARGPFSNARLVDVGASRGVVEGNPALSDHGVVGRVVGVAANASRIMLLTDIESRVPVLLPRTNGRAILAGDGGPNPTLSFLRTHDAPRDGDRVLTSGDGGVFPRGLPVGSVVRGYDGAWRVSLDADAAPIDYVQILLFTDFSQLTPPAALAPAALPRAATAPPPPSPTSPTAAVPTTKPPLADMAGHP